MNREQNNSKSVQVDTTGFNSEVMRSRQPVLAAFLATWSRPCQVLEPVLDEIAATCRGKLKVVRINADENPDICLWYDIRSIPTLVYFVAGGVRWRVVGTVSKADVLSRLELPPPPTSVLKGKGIPESEG